MRAEATHTDVSPMTPVFFGMLGLASGLGLWLFAGHLPNLSIAGTNVFHGLLFGLMIGMGFFLVRGEEREGESLPSILLFVLLTTALYWFVVKILFAGWFGEAFELGLWLRYLLCGVIGAGGMVAITGATLKKTPPAWVAPAMVIAGALCVLAAKHPFFLFPWWQGTMGLLIGFWVASED